MKLSPGNLFLSVLFIFLLNNYTNAQNVRLTVKVIVSPGIPKTDSLVIMGNQAAFGNWFDFSKGKMKKQDDTTWIYVGQFPVNTSLEFQITRGAYDKNALYTYGIHQPPKVPFIIKKDTVITIRPANWNDLFNNSITGTVKYYHNFEDHDLKYTRNVVVWLPPSYYKSPNKRFPVLYAHDGQNVFIPNSINSGEWRMDETADSLMRLGKIQEFIIVAIDNTKDRWDEYSGTPEGMAYINFIVNNLKPFIDKNYRTKTDKTNTAAIGSSMGGLISFYMVWLHPDVFSKAACLSSGFAYDNGHIIDKVASSSKKLPGTRLYLDCGDQELDKYFLNDNNRMYELLKKNHPEVKLSYKVFEGAAHNEYAWAKRLSDPLTYLFGDIKTQ
ncbi:MAG: Enterochelin esterase [Mucilaginibacter sp.]|nr:Enterochelin esterase [Mucilaginibacter sp.]